MYGELISNKSTKTIQCLVELSGHVWPLVQSCQQMMLGQLAADMNLNPHLIPYTKLNPKWIKDLNIKAKTIKLPEEYKGIDLYDLVLGKEFFAFLEETKKISKRKNYKQISFVKILKNISKDIIKNLKNKPTDCEEIFVNSILIKVLYPK